MEVAGSPPPRTNVTGPALLLLAGVSGSGKTTYARVLEAAGAVRLSIDEVVWERGGDWDALAPGVEDELRTRLIDLLRQGREVLLDYPLCRRAKRDAYRALANDLGARVELHWFEAPAEVLHRRVAARQASPGPNAFPVSTDDLDAYLAHAERPDADEQPIVHVTG